MVTKEDLTIEQLEDGNFVVKAIGIYQDIDFVNGGFIITQQRAEEIRDIMVKDINRPPMTPPPTTEEQISNLKLQLDEQAIALAALIGGAV